MLETLQTAEVGFSALLAEAWEKFGDYEKTYPEIAEIDESGDMTTNLLMVLNEPVVREWKRGKVRPVDHFDAANYEVGVTDHAITAGIPEKFLRYDKLGLMRNKMLRMPKRIRQHYEAKVWNALNAGFTTACWDGQNFFATAHPYATDEDGLDTFGNKFTVDLSHAAFNDGVERLQSIRIKDTDDPLNDCSDLVLYVGPYNRVLANEIVMEDKLAGNANAGMAKVVVVQKLAKYPRRWFLWDRSLGIKPVLLKINQRMDDIVTLDQPKDYNMFWQDEVIYGAKGEHECHYLHPYNIVGSIPA